MWALKCDEYQYKFKKRCSNKLLTIYNIYSEKHKKVRRSPDFLINEKYLALKNRKKSVYLKRQT